MSETAARLDPARMRRARAYRVFRRTISLVSSSLGIALMLALHFAGAGAQLRSQLLDQVLIDPPPRDDPMLIFLLIAVFMTIGWLVQLPLAYVGHARGVREGLVTQSRASALVDQVKSHLIVLAVIGLPLTAWYLVLQRPDWWLLTIIGVALLAALGFALGPVIAAIFYRFEPLGDADVAARVKAVAARASVRVEGVQRWGLGAKTTAANAAVMGLGPTKRIVLGDTLLSKFPLPEVEAVVAHEVGHQVNADTVRFTLVSALTGSATLILLRFVIDALTKDAVVAGMGLEGAADPASYPLLAALFGLATLLVRPFVMTYIRSRETAADAFGAGHTSPGLMASALVRLADQNLADPEPPRWEEVLFCSHPAIATRVRALGQPWPPP
jgi:STE24 endopeptidase